MSLKKKIVLSFFLSAGIIALLSGFLYLNFVEIHKETVFLELTDTIRSKSLQLRRHEKNYFLYAPAEATSETKAIHQYLTELDEILGGAQIRSMNRTASLHRLVQEYRSQFTQDRSIGRRCIIRIRQTETILPGISQGQPSDRGQFSQ